MTDILLSKINSYIEQKQKIQDALFNSMTEGVHYFSYEDPILPKVTLVLKKDGAKHIIEAHGYSFEFSDIEYIERTLQDGIIATTVACYCYVKDGDEVITRGYGARRLDLDYHFDNNAVKSAHRNALVDAALNIKNMAGLFSAEKASDYDYSNINKNYGHVNAAFNAVAAQQPEAVEMTTAQEEALLAHVMGDTSDEVEASQAPEQAAAKPVRSKADKSSLLAELKAIGPEQWLEDVPSMFGASSLEKMTIENIKEAIAMMKSSLDKQAQAHAENEESNIFI